MKKVVIGVVGHGTHATKIHEEVAKRVGELVAKRGGIVVCGGRNEGVMDAVARGVEEAGGISIGILPEADLSRASSHLTVAIPTGMGFARNQIIALSCDGMIVIGGGVGTLTEVAYAYAFSKPIVVIENLGGLVEQFIGRYLDKKERVKLVGAKTPEEAVELIFKLIEERK